MQRLGGMKKILAAVDGSPQSLNAARLGLELAKATGATLTLAYSTPPLALPGDVPFVVVNDVLRAELQRGKQILSDLKARLEAPVATLELEGPPAERIAEVAERDGYDLVVVGTRGRNAVARVLLGSVADRLIHICHKPVLVAR